MMQKELRTVQGEFDSQNEFKIILPDPIGGDMTFNFNLEKDTANKESRTRFHLVNEHEATITIFNAPINKRISMSDDQEIGTYGEDRILMMNYILSSKESKPTQIIVKFYTEGR